MKYYGKILDPKDLTTKEFVDNTLTASLGYTDDKCYETLQSAKEYTDTHASGKIDNITINGGPPVEVVAKTANLPIDKTTVNLGNVNNTSDLDKPISTATQAAITAHTSNTSNPHNVTKDQLGLSDVENKSEAMIKSDLTGQIVSGDTNFAVGGDVYNALQNKQDVIQVSTMPEASSTYENKVYQFIGTTTGSYNSGAFYKCVGTSVYSHAIQAYGSTSMEGSSYNANFTISNNSETLIDNYNSILTTLISKGYIRPNILQATGYFYFGGYTNIGGLYVDNRETPNVISLIDEDLEGVLAWISPEGNLIADTVTAVTTYSWQQVAYSKSELDTTLSNKASTSQLDDVIQTLMAYVDSKIDGAMNQQY